MLERVWREGNLLHCWWECKLVQPPWRTVQRFLKELRIKLPYDPTIPLLGILPLGNHNWKRHKYPSVHCSTIYNSQDTEATQMSITRWMDKEAVVHIYKGILAIKRNTFESVLMRLDEPRAYYTEGSQKEKICETFSRSNIFRSIKYDYKIFS